MKYSELVFFSNNFCKLAQQDPELEGPNVRIEPMEGLVQKAVDLMKQQDPNYFKGVRSIVLTPGSAYGFVESGSGRDHSVIHLNLDKIKQEAASKYDGSEDAMVDAIISTIAHEKGHITSFNPEQGFVGGEVPAEQEQQRFTAQVRN